MPDATGAFSAKWHRRDVMSVEGTAGAQRLWVPRHRPVAAVLKGAIPTLGDGPHPAIPCIPLNSMR